MRIPVGIISGIAWKEFLPASVVVINSLVWYTLNYAVLIDIINKMDLKFEQTIVFLGIYFIFIAVSAIIGGIVLPRARKKGIALWITLGMISSVSMLLISDGNGPFNTIILALLGISIGIGLPSALAYFANQTKVIKRGFLGGLTWFSIGVFVFILIIIINFLGTFSGILILILWRTIGLSIFLFSTRGKSIETPTQRIDTYRYILGRRDVILYLIPWIMFSVINYLIGIPITTNLMGSSADFYTFIVLVISGFFALFGGIFADQVGRKKVVITGFIIIGIAYASLSLFFGNMLSWILYSVLDGAAWGMLAVVFFMALWGDLSQGSEKERYYVLGGLPYLLAGFLPIIISPYVSLIEPNMAFSLASFFLFLAVLPLLYAPETLPEKSVKDRELKNYIEKAKKIASKE
jgi:MFS family permease